MAKHNQIWSPTASDSVSQANNHVCLAILRIFRNVSLSLDRHDYDDLGRPFWPLIRLERAHLRRALLSWDPERALAAAGRRETSQRDEGGSPAWLPNYTKARGEISEELPETRLLILIGEAIVNDTLAFRPLINAVESRLVKLNNNPLMSSEANVPILSKLLNLSDVEHRLLRLATALERGTIPSSLFAHVNRSPRMVEALRIALEQISDHDVRDAIFQDNRLLQCGLFEGGSNQDLEDLLRLSRQGSLLLMREVKSTDDMAAIVLKQLPVSNARIPLQWPQLQDRGALVLSALKNALKTQAKGINILLYGASGTGKTEFALRLIKEAGACGFSVDDTNSKDLAATRTERLADLQMSELFAPNGSSILVLDEAEDIFQDRYNEPGLSKKSPDGKSWMNNLLEKNHVPVIWISNKIDHIDPAYIRRFTYCLEFTTMPRRVRQQVAQTYLNEVGCSKEIIDNLASHEYVPPALLSSAVRFVELCGEKDQMTIDIAVKSILTDHLKAMGRSVPTQIPVRSTRFDLNYLNVKGNVSAESVVRAVQRTGVGSILLGGPPGTGKTQLAAEIASQLGRELTYKTAADINSMWFGGSERNVARMFVECDPHSEVLFLDEADTLLGSRDGGAHRADRAVTSEFLRRIEAFEGVFVCASNYSLQFDAALMRRFTFRMNFLPLTMAQRTRLFAELALGWDADGQDSLPVIDSMQLVRLNRLDLLTPGDFANVVKRVRALEMNLDVSQWLDELTSEHEAKPQAGRSTIGFV